MRLKGQEQVSLLFGVAPKTITEWQVLGFPVAVQGGPGVPSEYDAPACIQWLVEREVRKVRAETPKDRLARLQGDRLEQEILRDAKLLVPSDEVEPMWASAVLNAREFLRGEPPRLASLIAGLEKPKMEEVLRSCFEDFLTRLSNWRSAGDEEEDASDDGEEDEQA